MTTPEDLRKKRLDELLDLACIARGWTRGRLAQALGRDASNVSSVSGNPKLDYLVRLAAVLEWPLGEVGAAIWGAEATTLTPAAQLPSPNPPDPSASYEQARAASYESMKLGDYNTAIEHTRTMYRTARTEDERSRAIANESGCWNWLGRHQMAVDTAQRGLILESLTVNRRLHLQTNLVLAHFKLHDLTRSLRLAESIVKQASANLGIDPRIRRWLALAHYTKACSHQYLMFIESDRKAEHSAKAFRDFAAAKQEFRAAAGILNEPELLGIANSCEAGLVELEVESGCLTPGSAVARINAKLEEAIDYSGMLSSWIESYGWWALAGAGIAVRHLSGAPMHQALAVFTNKAMEIASISDQLHMKARLYDLEFRTRQARGEHEPLALDEEDLIGIAQATQYIPWFRPIGMQLLRESDRVGGKRFARTDGEDTNANAEFDSIDWRALIDESPARR